MQGAGFRLQGSETAKQWLDATLTTDLFHGQHFDLSKHESTSIGLIEFMLAVFH